MKYRAFIGTLTTVAVFFSGCNMSESGANPKNWRKKPAAETQEQAAQESVAPEQAPVEEPLASTATEEPKTGRRFWPFGRKSASTAQAEAETIPEPEVRTAQAVPESMAAESEESAKSGFRLWPFGRKSAATPAETESANISVEKAPEQEVASTQQPAEKSGFRLWPFGRKSSSDAQQLPESKQIARTGYAEIDQSVKLIASKQYAQALQILDSYVARVPNNAEGYSLRGDCLYQMLKFEEASASYSKALELSPSYLPSLRGLGLTELNLGIRLRNEDNMQDAYFHFVKSLESLRLYLKNGTNEARDTYAKTIYGEALAVQGVCQYFTKRSYYLLRMRNDIQGAETMRDRLVDSTQEGVAAATRFKNYSPGSVEPYILMGGFYMRAGCLFLEFGENARAAEQIRKAYANWQEALRRDSANVEANTNLLKCREILEKLNKVAG